MGSGFGGLHGFMRCCGGQGKGGGRAQRVYGEKVTIVADFLQRIHQLLAGWRFI